MRAAILDQRITGVSYGWEGARNNSPSVQRVNGAVVRRNLARNPRAVSAAVWTGYRAKTIPYTDDQAGVYSYETGTGPDGVNTYVRQTGGAGTTETYYLEIGGTNSVVNPITLAPGTPVSAQIMVRSSLAVSVMIRVRFGFDGSADATGPAVTLVPNVWTMLTASATVPEVSSIVSVVVTSYSGPALGNGSTIDATKIQITATHSPLPYFDGDTQVNAATINRVTTL